MKYSLSLVLALIGVQMFTAAPNLRAQAAPNVIFILVDDMAYNGISSFGGKHVKTPHIDSLANGGMKFTHAYAMPQCSPSRAALLSGQDCARTHLTAVVKEFRDLQFAPVVQPNPVRQLPYDTYTIGKMFRDKGYAAAHVGKWHIDEYEKANQKELGVDEYFKRYGFISLMEPKLKIDPKNIFSCTAATIDFIEKSVASKKPFFAYVAHNAVHSEYEARPELIEKYVKLGYASEDPKTQKFPAQLLAMTEELDNGIGLMLNKLRELGIENNTIIAFMSDNGCRDKSWDHAPFRGGKGAIQEGGIRVPLIVKWPEAVKPGSVSATPVHIVDIYPTLMEIVGGSVPNNHILDGQSLVPLLTNKGVFKERPVFVHHPHYVPNYNKTPSTMIRLGDYKLTHFYGDQINLKTGALIPGEKWELYDVVNDSGESKELSALMPEKFKAMQKELERWLSAVGAQIPTPNANTDLSKWKTDFEKVREAEAAKEGSKSDKKKSKSKDKS